MSVPTPAAMPQRRPRLDPAVLDAEYDRQTKPDYWNVLGGCGRVHPRHRPHCDQCEPGPSTRKAA